MQWLVKALVHSVQGIMGHDLLWVRGGAVGGTGRCCWGYGAVLLGDAGRCLVVAGYSARSLIVICMIASANLIDRMSGF